MNTKRWKGPYIKTVYDSKPHHTGLRGIHFPSSTVNRTDGRAEKVLSENGLIKRKARKSKSFAELAPGEKEKSDQRFNRERETRLI
jgi:hypothetical protein